MHPIVPVWNIVSRPLTQAFSIAVLLCAAQIAIAQTWPRLQTAEWTKTNFDKMSVEPSEIRSGGPPRDGIPPIDSPKFISLKDASEWLAADEPVVAFAHNDHARAYPLQILIYHEIVNDTVGGEPFAVTFCPLCNASIVFERKLDDKVLDFGTTGRLRKSDLIMYDRQTESWWQQFTGTAIIGDYTDVTLKQVPSQIVSFNSFAEAFPDGEVLSKETGYPRMYGRNPYSGYDSIDSNPFLYDGELDPRLPPMERVLSIPSKTSGESGKDFQLVPLSILEENPILQFEVGDSSLVVLAPSSATSALDQSSIADSRQVPAAAAFSRVVKSQSLDFEFRDGSVFDKQTGSQWNSLGRAVAGSLSGEKLEQVDRGVHFAFAWLAFDPEATIVKGP